MQKLTKDPDIIAEYGELSKVWCLVLPSCKIQCPPHVVTQRKRKNALKSTKEIRKRKRAQNKDVSKNVVSKFRKLNSGEPHHRFREKTLLLGLPDMIVRWDELRAKKKRYKQRKINDQLQITLAFHTCKLILNSYHIVSAFASISST